MVQNDDQRPWGKTPSADFSAIDAPKLIMNDIEGVEPLGDQFGVHPIKTVPDLLYDPLFGQPVPTKAETDAVGGDPANVPPMQTYAILDAARLVNLCVALDTSGLAHRCLFKGEAYDDLKDVAPWIVQLEEGNDFTRHLFTSGKAPWFLWNKEPGIYLRARGSLDDMWQHFRKFTRVKDEAEKWYYFRFWEPTTALTYFEAIQNDAVKILNWFYPKQAKPIFTFVVIDTEKNMAKEIRADDQSGLSETPMAVFTLGQYERTVLNNRRLETDVSELTALLMQSFPEPLAEMNRDEAEKTIRKSMSRMGDFQIKQKENLFRLVAWDLHTDGAFEKEDPDGQLRAILEMDITETDKMRRLTNRITELENDAASNG